MSIKIEMSQALVDTMVRGLASQGWKKSTRKTGECSYFTSGGKRCAVGWLLTEAQARELSKRSVTIGSLIMDGDVVVRGATEMQMSELQMAHDGPRMYMGDFSYSSEGATHVKKAVKHWCETNGYTFNDPDAKKSEQK